MRILPHAPQPRMMTRGRAAAFTLVEMIVVITIITILLTVGALGLKNLSKGTGVSAGLPTAEAVFAEARALAIGKGTNARVLISADKDNEERYLRYMLVAYLHVDSSGNDKWVAESRGVFLPEGVYFSQEYSKKDHSSGIDKIEKLPASEEDIYGSPEQLTPNTNLSGSYYYYEYTSEGIVSNPGTSFIIGIGNKPPGAENPRASAEGVKNFGGFVIWRKGTTSVFRHPEQMKIPGDLKSGDNF